MYLIDILNMIEFMRSRYERNVSLNRLIWCKDEKTLEKYNKYVSDIAKK